MLKKILVMVIGFCVIGVMFSGVAWGEVPQSMQYQGRITDSTGNAISGDLSLSFELGTMVWTSVWESESMTVTADENGLFDVTLSGGTPDLSTVDFSNPYLIKVFKDGIAVGDPQPLASVPYALNVEWTKSGDNIYYNEGKVGIGVTSPREKFSIRRHTGEEINFHMGGTQAIASNAYYSGGWKHSVDATVAAPVTPVKLHFRPNSFSIDVAGGGDAGSAVPPSSWNTALRIRNNGNVGIGTDDPNSKLHVEGDITIGDTGSAINHGGTRSFMTAVCEASVPAGDNSYFFSNVFPVEGNVHYRILSMTGTVQGDTSVGNLSQAIPNQNVHIHFHHATNSIRVATMPTTWTNRWVRIFVVYYKMHTFIGTP